uniref:Uncharacterized protein n=1 Tax=Arundo donax TaxID=35708 RepID=A0A0A8YUZ3_ARUDO
MPTCTVLQYTRREILRCVTTGVVLFFPLPFIIGVFW